MFRLLILLFFFPVLTCAGPLYDYVFVEGPQAESTKSPDGLAQDFLLELHQKEDLTIIECLQILNDFHDYVWEGQLVHENRVAFDNLIEMARNMRQNLLEGTIEDAEVINHFRDFLILFSSSVLLKESAFIDNFYIEEGLPHLLREVKKEHEFYRKRVSGYEKPLSELEDTLFLKFFGRVSQDLCKVVGRLERQKIHVFLNFFESIFERDISQLPNYNADYKVRAEKIMLKIRGFQDAGSIDLAVLKQSFREMQIFTTEIIDDLKAKRHRLVEDLVGEFEKDANNRGYSDLMPDDMLEKAESAVTPKSWAEWLSGT